MSSPLYCTLHPHETSLTDEFYYGNMRVKRLPLVRGQKTTDRMLNIYYSYVAAGLLPHGTELLGDYLEHALTKGSEAGYATAGHYLGVVLPGGNYQYLRLDGESIGVRKDKLNPPEEIHVLTDTCLFCAANATATLSNGQVVSVVAPRTGIHMSVHSLTVSERLCYYEMDAILRLSDLIRAMSSRNERFTRAMMAMPTVEYYFYLMDAYNAGFVERDMMLEWITKVNRHADIITGAISKRTGLTTRICQPLAGVAAYIEDSVQKGNRTDFDRVKSMLASISTLWAKVLPIARPREWKQLNYANYVVSVLECSQHNDAQARLTVDIENPSEQRILRNAAKTAAQLRKGGAHDRFRVVGIYPHEKVFIPGDDECRRTFPRLYYLEEQADPGQTYYRAIVEGNRRKVFLPDSPQQPSHPQPRR